MENAYKGIKKIYLAEMFAVLSIFIDCIFYVYTDAVYDGEDAGRKM